MTKLINTKWRLLILVTALGLILSTGCSSNENVKTEKETVQPVRENRPVSSGKYRTVALADLDKDGYIDVVAGGRSPTSLSISYGDGKGKLSKPQFLPVDGDVQSITLVDVNGDDYKDIVFTVQKNATGVIVWKNQPPRKWLESNGPTLIGDYQGIENADVNGDGHLDIIAANASPDAKGGIQVWLGDGRGNWNIETGPSRTGRYMDIALADFNEDGIPDMAGSSWGVEGFLGLWLGDGSGNWSALLPLAKGSYYGLGSGDINNDGHVDLVAATYREGVHVFAGNGQGGFNRLSSPTRKGTFWDVMIMDLDADGVIELLASSPLSGGIKAWRYTEKKWEIIQGRFSTQGSYYEIAAGDLDMDGIEDICAANWGEGIKFWNGRREAPFTSISAVIAGQRTSDQKDLSVGIEQNDAYTTASGFVEYRIGPGDILEITLWQGTEATREEVLVRPDGRISFGFIDDLHVDGLTPTQLDRVLTDYHTRYLKQPRIDVVVKDYKSKYVSLTGALGGGIRTSSSGTGTGRYALTGKNRILELVARAGGPSRDANLREVRVRRKNGQTKTLNLFRAIYQGDPSQDIIMNDGDLVYFPTLATDANRVYVFGEVAGPGAIKLPESNMRLFDAILEAGGPTIFAQKREAKIVRGDINNPEIISVDLKRLLEEGDQTQNILLASGDLIYVPRSTFGDINQFWKRVRPLFELVISPARIVNEWDEAINTLGN